MAVLAEDERHPRRPVAQPLEHRERARTVHDHRCGAQVGAKLEAPRLLHRGEQLAREHDADDLVRAARRAPSPRRPEAARRMTTFAGASARFAGAQQIRPERRAVQRERASQPEGALDEGVDPRPPRREVAPRPGHDRGAQRGLVDRLNLVHRLPPACERWERSRRRGRGVAR